MREGRLRFTARRGAQPGEGLATDPIAVKRDGCGEESSRVSRGGTHEEEEAQEGQVGPGNIKRAPGTRTDSHEDEDLEGHERGDADHPG